MSKHSSNHNEQTLRPVQSVVAECKMYCETKDNMGGWLIPYEGIVERYLYEWLDTTLTTDRDAAYTMLREAVIEMQNEIPTTSDRPFELAESVGKRMALDDILKSLDTIYGKTHTV